MVLETHFRFRKTKCILNERVVTHSLFPRSVKRSMVVHHRAEWHRLYGRAPQHRQYMKAYCYQSFLNTFREDYDQTFSAIRLLYGWLDRGHIPKSEIQFSTGSLTEGKPESVRIFSDKSPVLNVHRTRGVSQGLNVHVPGLRHGLCERLFGLCERLSSQTLTHPSATSASCILPQVCQNREH